MIKAIETEYNGYRFRSRLEARWGVFFNKAGIKYEYEPADFNLPSGRYLPDFHLLDQDCYVEIKGQNPTEAEIKKMEELAENTMCDVHIFYGEIEIPGTGHFYEKVYSQMISWEGSRPLILPYCKNETGWAQCPWCLSLGITYHSMLYGLPCKCYKYISKLIGQDRLQDFMKHYPDITRREPTKDTKLKHPFYSLAINDWWRDKTNALLYGGDSPLLIAAYTAARQARFEHGETPT